MSIEFEEFGRSGRWSVDAVSGISMTALEIETGPVRIHFEDHLLSSHFGIIWRALSIFTATKLSG